MASPTTNKGYTYPAHGGSVNSWDTPIDADFDQIDLNVGGPYNIVLGSTIAGAAYNSTYATISSSVATATLPSSNAQNVYYNVTGTSSQNTTITFPAAGGFYIINNNTTGTLTLTANTAAGGSSGKALPQGLVTEIVSDATNIYTVGGSTLPAQSEDVLISNTVVASTIIVNISSYSAYKAIKFHFYNIVPTTPGGTNYFVCQLSSDGTNYASSGYSWAIDGFTTDGVNEGLSNSPDRNIRIGTASSNICGDFIIYNPSATAATLCRYSLAMSVFSDPGFFAVMDGVGTGGTIAAVQAVKLTMSSTNGLTSGSYTVVGIK